MSNLQEVDVVNKEELSVEIDTQVKDVNGREAAPEYLQTMIDSVDGSIPKSTCLALEAILLIGHIASRQDDLHLSSWNVPLLQYAVWTLQCRGYFPTSDGCGMSGLQFEVCLVYLERLVRVLRRLESAGLKLKPENAD